MTKKQILTLAVVAIAVVGVLVYLAVNKDSSYSTSSKTRPAENSALKGTVQVKETAPPPPGSKSTAPIPRESVLLEISDGNITPDEFTVTAGSAVTLSVASADNAIHMFQFKNPTLSDVNLGIGPGETLKIAFVAPEPNTYEFFCGVKDHEARGERGQMIVVQ